MSGAMRTAWVTGAAQGIGAAITRRLVDAGIRVALIDRDAEKLASTTTSLEREGAVVRSLAADLCETSGLESRLQRLSAEFGPADILVNNAGIALWGDVHAFPLDAWMQTMAVNLHAPFLLVQHCLPHMRDQGWGRIVNIASVSGLRAGTGRLAYGTSKAALIAMTQQVAVEAASWGVTANAVAPGAVQTEMTRNFHKDRERILARVPAGCYGSPEDIACAVAFLASNEAAYINGHVLTVDGGFSSAGFLSPTANTA